MHLLVLFHFDVGASRRRLRRRLVRRHPKAATAAAPPKSNPAAVQVVQARLLLRWVRNRRKTKKEDPQELLARELAEAEQKMKTERHELLLQLADFENNKKKNNAEREGRRRNAMLNCVRKMVDVYSEFDRFAHMEDNVKEMSAAGTSLKDGINLTRDLYRQTMEKFDVMRMVPKPGDPFVSSKHDEVGIVDSADVPAGTIAKTVKYGWVFEPGSSKPVILKKAQVKVASSGPATPPPPP